MYKIVYLEKGKKLITYTTLNKNEIRKKFAQEGKVVLSIEKEKLRKINNEELAVGFQSIADLLEAGIKLSDALSVVEKSIVNKDVKKIIAFMYANISEGKYIHEGLEKILDPFVYSILKSSYESGGLIKGLRTCANYIKTSTELKRQFIKNLTYPLAVFSIGLIALLINSLFVAPKIMGSELMKIAVKDGKEPLIVIANKFITQSIPFAILFFILLVVGLIIYYKIDKKNGENLILKIPYLKQILLYQNFASAFWSLKEILSAGETLSNALGLIAKNAVLYKIREDFTRAKKFTEVGKNFAEGFKFISDIEKAMLSSAVSIDTIIQVCDVTSKRFFREYEEALKSLTPKIYFIVLALVLGIFVTSFLSIFIPYTEILRNIQNVK